MWQSSSFGVPMGVHLPPCASYGNVMRQITRSSADDAAIFAVLLRTWGNVALGETRGFIVIDFFFQRLGVQ